MPLATIFVFGSNLGGVHGCGSAAEAVRSWGAVAGVGAGPTGQAYALPTKDANFRPLPLSVIHHHVRTFFKYAADRPATRFIVVRIGCGRAGYMEDEIAPFFSDAPANCVLPEGWRR